MDALQVRVRVDSDSLRHALEGFLRQTVEPWSILDSHETLLPEGNEVVITTDSSCPLDECRTLARQARAVIVLAAVPRASAQDLYLHAGASAYLPMDATGESLVRVLHAILAHPAGE